MTLRNQTLPAPLPPGRVNCWRNRSRVLALGLCVAFQWILAPGHARAGSPLVSLAGRLPASPESKPFISLLNVKMADTALLSYVQFTIQPKPGSLTRPVSARYSNAYLLRRLFLNPQTGNIIVPVFGLYAGYTNSVQVVFGFVDGTSQVAQLSLTTAAYAGGIYNHPLILQARARNTTLSYDYIMLKNYASADAPIIIDSDGEIRWVGTADTASPQVILFDGSFFVVNQTTVLRMEWDGTVTTVLDFGPQGITGFYHNFDFGKTGIFMNVDTAEYTESIVMEVDTSGNVLHTWNLAEIISAAMLAGGDNPASFVAAPGTLDDWFHNNSVAYRPADDTVIFSSRENFVIALDYGTGAIKWILGDPTKQWYQFPSLRKYALKMAPGGHYPIGQHSVSFYLDKLLLFDDGLFSIEHTPPGRSRNYSAPRKYSIAENAGSATEIWNYLANPSIYSPVASSVYEDQPGNYLVDYATAGPYLFAELIGLDARGAKAFDYEFTELLSTDTAWNAVPLHMEDLVFN